MLVTIAALVAILTLNSKGHPVDGRPRSPSVIETHRATPAAVDGAAQFPLTLEDLAKLGMAPEELLQMLKERASGRINCHHTSGHGNGINHNSMERFFLNNKTVTCNDGSSAGYYLRLSPDSDRWLVFLEGGWYCFDRTSCHGRWINTPQLMSSERWPERRKGTGILSAEEDENPYLHDANIVYVPYCSSDSWSGTYTAQHKGDFSFMGSLIIEEVIKQLLSDHNLGRAKRLIIAGSSAGGTGVLLNIDHLAGVMSQRATRVDVRGIADSGWFLDNRQYKKVPCTEAHLCAPTEGIQRGINLWHGRVPDRCTEREKWKCYFGYRIYATLKTPIFVVQHLFDEAQITADNVGPPVKKEQWRYIHNMGKDMKHTLMNVSAVFAPACLSHIALTRREWHKVSIDGVTLPQALACWESSQRETNHYNLPSTYLTPRLITGEYVSRPRHKYLNDDPFKSRSRRKKHRKKRNRGKKRKRRKGKRKDHKGGNRSSRVQPSTPNRSRRSLWFDQHDIHHIEYHENQCNHHRLDHCAWPQCNLSCPKIHNPFTGEEMDFIDLLLQFGLDLTSIANALGMDLPTLQSMDHDLLLRKLIQQS